MSEPALPGPLQRASVIDRINAVFLAVVCAFTAIAWPRMPHGAEAAILYAGLFGILYLVGGFRYSRVPPRAKAIAMFVYPVAFLLCLFESFTFVMPWFRSVRFDEALIRLDHDLFGVHPTVWLERLASPWFTDLMYALYFFYFPMPLFVGIPMFRRGEHRALERWFTAFFFCYYGAYVICFFVPASGPRFHLASEQTVPLDGVFLAEPIRRTIDVMEPNKLDAFPSLHAGILLLTMLLAWRHARRTFWVFVPVALGITLSLVYLRYHYVVDVIAGFAWATIAYLAAGALFERLRERAAPHFGPDRT
jgi:membrane-associated phospholipid phosphatase